MNESEKDIMKIHHNLEENINKINLNNIEPKQFNHIFDKKSVKYRRSKCPNLYNEIQVYLSKKELPLSLISPFMNKVEIIIK